MGCIIWSKEFFFTNVVAGWGNKLMKTGVKKTKIQW